MKNDKTYFVKQKLLGVAIILLSILMVVAIKDATVAIITLPLGISLLFSKDKLIVGEHFQPDDYEEIRES